MNNWISTCLLGITSFLCSTFLLTGNAVAKFSDEFAEGDLDGDGIVHVALGIVRGQKTGRFIAWAS